MSIPGLPSILNAPAKPRTALVKLPRGPRLFNQPTELATGPGDPPPGFLGNRNSKLEWIPYWALATIFGEPIDPRQPPFVGAPPRWVYQSPIGGFDRYAIIDFVVYDPPPGSRRGPVAIRIVTEHFHIFADNRQMAYDAIQRERAETGYDLVDVLDIDLLRSRDGQSAILAMKRALAMIEPLNPIVAGTAVRPSRMGLYG
ncbi:MAG: hypothetical protein C4523_19630 [Myxococcales bacterium]|nr:MAG: hypothetical protein C4523_19630 [Myxococcales bacterium]